VRGCKFWPVGRSPRTFEGFEGDPSGCDVRVMETNLTGYLAFRKKLPAEAATPFEGFEGGVCGCNF
jgi:hypothetical protein